MGLRECLWFAQGQSTSQWQSHDLSSCLLTVISGLFLIFQLHSDYKTLAMFDGLFRLKKEPLVLQQGEIWRHAKSQLVSTTALCLLITLLDFVHLCLEDSFLNFKIHLKCLTSLKLSRSTTLWPQVE